MRLLLSNVLVAVSLAAQQSPQYEGVIATQQGRLEDAVAAFERAVAADPSSIPARLHLGAALLARYPPGSTDPQAAAAIRRAADEFDRVLGLDPENRVALETLASLSFRQANAVTRSERHFYLSQAEQSYRRLATVDPSSKAAWYGLGVVAWAEAYQPILEARTRAGMRPADPAPITDSSARSMLRNQFGHVLQEGIADLERAIDIDPGYGDAFAYLNLLHRLRANLAGTPEEYAREIALADAMVEKALEAKKRLTPAPPSPSSASEKPAVPKQIRIGSNVMAAKLVRSIAPIYPPLAAQARIQGVVRFDATVGHNGRVIKLQLVSGHPLLVPAAEEAAKQYEYQPTMLNGQPAEVLLQLGVPFTLPQ